MVPIAETRIGAGEGRRPSCGAAPAPARPHARQGTPSRCSARDYACHDCRLPWCSAGRCGTRTWGRPGRATVTVRTYVVTMAPEGRRTHCRGCRCVTISSCAKGDVLLVIDPTNYQIAVRACRGGRAFRPQANAEDHRCADHGAAGPDRREPGTGGTGAGGGDVSRNSRPRDTRIWPSANTAPSKWSRQTASNLRKDQAALKNEQAALTLARAPGRVAQGAACKRRGDDRAGLREPRPGQDQSGSVRKSALRWMAGWTNLLAQLGGLRHRRQRNVIALCRCQLLLGRRLFSRGNPTGLDTRGRPGQRQADGPTAKSCVARFGKPRARGINVLQCPSRPAGAGHGEPDLHLGASGAGAYQCASASRRCPTAFAWSQGLTATVEVEPRRWAALELRSI